MKLLMSNRKLESENEKLRVNREKYKFKEFDGITLITLVITIIILIILAGVGINLSIGENGLFTKAKQARENYIIATNEEVAMIENLEKQIGNSNTSGDKNTSETITSDGGEYFFTSYNGYKNTLGEGKINSLYGLAGTKYETVSDTDWKQCKYEKKLGYSFDLSKEFEISLKHRIEMDSSNEMGGIRIFFQKTDDTNNMVEDILTIAIQDAWNATTQVSTYIEYSQETIYSVNERTNTKYSTIGVVSDGTNIKVYSNDILLATADIKSNLSFDKISINFVQYQGIPSANKNYLERLYFGNIKYYKDIL